MVRAAMAQRCRGAVDGREGDGHIVSAYSADDEIMPGLVSGYSSSDESVDGGDEELEAAARSIRPRGGGLTRGRKRRSSGGTKRAHRQQADEDA